MWCWYVRQGKNMSVHLHKPHHRTVLFVSLHGNTVPTRREVAITVGLKENMPIPGPAPCREKAHIATQVIIYEHVHYSVRFRMYGHILLTSEMYQGYRGSLNMDTIPRISAACWWPPVTTDLLNHNVFLCILTARLQHYNSNIQTWSICAMHAYIWT